MSLFAGPTREAALVAAARRYVGFWERQPVSPHPYPDGSFIALRKALEAYEGGEVSVCHYCGGDHYYENCTRIDGQHA